MVFNEEELVDKFQKDRNKQTLDVQFEVDTTESDKIVESTNEEKTRQEAIHMKFKIKIIN